MMVKVQGSVRLMMTAGAMVVAAACCHQVQAAPLAPVPAKPVLTLEFENGFDGTGREGQPVPARVEGKPELAEGKFGKAMKSGPGTGYLHFPLEGIVSKQYGTVEMWVSPLDWTGGERAFHSFFDARGQGAIYLYKFFSTSSLLMLTAPAPNGPYHSAGAGIDSWKPGEWHHIAGTWSPRQQAVYVDGKLVATQTPNLPKELDKEFRIGDHPWNETGITRTSQSLIDRVRIYDRPLSPEHIAAHYKGDYEKAIPLTLNSAKLDYTVDTAAHRLKAGLGIMGSDVDMTQVRADFTIRQGDRTVQEQRDRRFDDLDAEADFTLNLKPGLYQLTAAIRDLENNELGRTATELQVPDPGQWRGNSIGKEKKVLPPWTPMKVTKTATGYNVACWGREYRFGAAPLPVQIISQGQPLLQSPLAVHIVAGGKPLSWTRGGARVTKSSDYEVDVTGTATARVPQGEIRLSTQLHFEYDGLMLVTLNLQVPPRFAPDAVRLDVPVREARALYRHGWGEDWKPFSGALPAGSGVVVKSSFLPAAWLGDNERGLFWFCESAQHWPNWQDANAFETIRENGAATMRFNLMKGQAVPPNWTFQCGLQATPVKPLPRDWRKWRLAPAPRPNLDVPWPTSAPDSMKYFGYPAAANPDLFEKRIEALREKGINAIPYSLLNGIDSAAPEWKWYGKNWSVNIYDPPANVVSPTQSDWRDFVIWKTKEFVERYKLGGTYHDLTYPYGLNVAAANTGWQDGEVRRKTFPIMAFRELYRRNYAMVKAANPNAHLMGHMSSRLAIPVLAYEDSYLNGETFRGKVNDSYMDVMPLDQWRAEYIGRQWGVIPFLLPEFPSAESSKIAPTRGLAGLTLLHDVSVWPIWSNSNVWKAMYDALDEFSYIESDFIPYFDPKPPATTAMPDVYISVYKRADGRALAVVTNTSREPRQGTVTLNAQRIGLPTTNLINWPDRTAVTRNGDTVNVSLEGLDYKLLLIGQAPAKKEP